MARHAVRPDLRRGLRDAPGRRFLKSETDAELVQKLDQLQPVIAVFPHERLGHLASSGPT
jgi:hypothetical protein